jgi:hypothetical protein
MLEGEVNPYLYANASPTMHADPTGLYVPGIHNGLAFTQAQGTCLQAKATELGNLTAGVDGQAGSQLPENSHIHSMCAPGIEPKTCQKRTQDYVQQELRKCTLPALANALHAIQDSFAPGHKGGKEWHGMPWEEGGESWASATGHFFGDLMPTSSAAASATRKVILKYCENCGECKK